MSSDLGLPLGTLERARRAYELGRIRHAVIGGALVAATVGALACLVEGPHALAWTPVAFAVWGLLAWRGGALLEGGRWGVLAGAATFALPMSILRPCCKPGMDMATMGVDCCTRPELCIASGVGLGLLLAMSLPQRDQGRGKRAVGAMAGVLAVATLRCAALFYGEALGLLGGIALGVIATSALRHFWYARAPHGNSR